MPVTMILNACLVFVMQVPAFHHQLLVSSEVFSQFICLVKSCFLRMCDTDILFIV